MILERKPGGGHRKEKKFDPWKLKVRFLLFAICVEMVVIIYYLCLLFG